MLTTNDSSWPRLAEESDTVSRWLGHKNGGALAMKVYGHLRNQRSQEMARKVKF